MNTNDNTQDNKNLENKTATISEIIKMYSLGFSFLWMLFFGSK